MRNVFVVVACLLLVVWGLPAFAVQLVSDQPDVDGLVAKYLSSDAELRDLLLRLTGETTVADGFVRIGNPFGGFPWLMTRLGRSRDTLVLCEAEMVFASEGASDIPVRRMKALKERVMREGELSFVSEYERPFEYRAVARSQGVKYVFLVRTEADRTNLAHRRYVLSFTAGLIGWRPKDEPFSAPYYWDWASVVHETRVPRASLGDESAWRYVVASGKDSETLLREWVDTGNRGILACGHSEIGVCLNWEKGDATVCTEAEATDYPAFIGAYVQAVDRDTQQRRWQMLTNPRCFRKGKRTEPGRFFVGTIYWDLIPGDTIEWREPERWRRVGTVVEPGSEGAVWWEPIKAYVRVTEEEELATEEDWKPTELTLKYQGARLEAMRGQNDFERYGTNAFERLRERLGEYARDMKPGVFRPLMRGSVLDMSVPTKAKARRTVLAGERNAYGHWQYELWHGRRTVLANYYGWHNNNYKHPVPDRAARERLGLTRYEDHLVRALPGWCALDRRQRNEFWLTVALHTGYRPLGERLKLDEGETVASLLDELDGLVRAEREKRTWVFWTDERLFRMWRACEYLLESGDGEPRTDELEAAVVRTLKAHSETGPEESLFYTLALEFGENPRTWRILEDVRGGVTNKSVRTLDALVDSEWHRHCQGKSDAVVIPEGWPYDQESVGLVSEGLVLAEAVPLPYAGVTNSFLYVYRKDGEKLPVLRIYTLDRGKYCFPWGDEPYAFGVERGLAPIAVGVDGRREKPNVWVRWRDPDRLIPDRTEWYGPDRSRLYPGGRIDDPSELKPLWHTEALDPYELLTDPCEVDVDI